MVTTAELNRRGLRYAVVVDGAATPASLADLDDKGLPYLVEVADGATMASRRALEARGLRYLVPVLVDATSASKASLAAQGLRYAVQVDADILPADQLVLQRQGLACYVEVDSSGNSVSAAAVGGAALLVGEANGFATDFTHPVDAERVAVKTSGASVASTVDGFFTQSGTSPKMVYDVAGTLVWSPHNMLVQSETLNALGWGPNNVTAVSATRIVETATTSGHSITTNTIPVSVTGAPYCFWVEATAAECDRIMLYGLSLGGQGLGFDLTNGTTFTVDTIPNGGLLSSGILSLGSGRYRCWISLNATGTAGNPGLYMCSGTAFSYAGNTSRGVTIHRQQLNRGTVPTAYLPTTSAARFGLALDYDPVTHAAKGLLVEPAATNEQFPSSAFDDALWPKTSCTVSANAIAAPNGLIEADAVIPSAGLFNAYVNRSALVTNGSNTTFSLFIKNGTLGSNWIRVAIIATPTYSTWFNLAAGTAGSSAGSPVSYNITALPGGWYRLTTTFLPGAASATVYLAAETGDGSSAGITGDGVKPAFYLWGAQMEVGAVATSHIPTTNAASVTRAADNISFLLSTIPAISTEFTLYGRWQTNAPTNSRFAYCVNDNQGTPGDYAGFLALTSQARLAVYDGTVNQATIVAGSLAANTTVAMAGRVKANDFSVSMNGAAVATDVAGTQPTVTHVRFGNTGGSSAALGQFYVEKMAIYPRGMTNAELVTRSST